MLDRSPSVLRWRHFLIHPNHPDLDSDCHRHVEECEDEEPASSMLSILSRYVDQTPDIKFFIVWQPEPQIHSELRLAALQPTTQVLTLHCIDHFPADDDIRLFWGIRLADIAKTRSDGDLSEGWPGSPDRDILCDQAACLIIYAPTAVKSIDSEDPFPRKANPYHFTPIEHG